jgi:hypothetical protein
MGKRKHKGMVFNKKIFKKSIKGQQKGALT